MRILLLSLFCLFVFGQLAFSQNDSTQSWIDILSQSTVSFGKDTIVDYKNESGQIVKKRIFNIVGTGVVFYIKQIVGNDTFVIPSIVTAKHVVFQPENNYKPRSLNIRFKWDEAKPLDKHFGVELNFYNDEGGSLWTAHPDMSVDLACIPLRYETQLIVNKKLHVLPYSIIKSLQNSYEAQEVFVLGFPGIGGLEYATKPIIRRGIISWISPIDPDKVPFLVDCNVYPGNSGGPIFANESGLGKSGLFNINGGFSFMGIVSKMVNKINPISSEDSKYILDGNSKPIYSIESFALGVIEPAFRVRELLLETERQINGK